MQTSVAQLNLTSTRAKLQIECYQRWTFVIVHFAIKCFKLICSCKGLALASSNTLLPVAPVPCQQL